MKNLNLLFVVFFYAQVTTATWSFSSTHNRYGISLVSDDMSAPINRIDINANGEFNRWSPSLSVMVYFRNQNLEYLESRMEEISTSARLRRTDVTRGFDEALLLIPIVVFFRLEQFAQVITVLQNIDQTIPTVELRLPQRDSQTNISDLDEDESPPVASDYFFVPDLQRGSSVYGLYQNRGSMK